MCLVETGAIRAPRDFLFRNHDKNLAPEFNLNYLQNIPIYYISGKYKLSNCSLSIAAQSFSGAIFCAPHKTVFGLVRDRNSAHKSFSVLNLTLIFIFIIFSISLLNETLFLDKLFSSKYTLITDCISTFDETLTD